MKKILLVVMLFFTLGMQSQEKYAVLSEIPWTEIVTSQPEGFVVNQDGNVTITSGEGLAWLISTVNGLNGQESNDYKDVVINEELKKSISIKEVKPCFDF